jgi:hypothetical protein
LFSDGLNLPAQQKLPEPLYLFNDVKDRFHGGFAGGIDLSSYMDPSQG